MAWPIVELSEVIKQDQTYVTALDPVMYKKLSVRLYGRGVVPDKPVDGASVLMKRHQFARAGQIIVSEIWAKKGALGIVPPEGDGALCTSHFYLFDIDTSRLTPRWFHYLTVGNFFGVTNQQGGPRNYGICVCSAQAVLAVRDTPPAAR